MVQKREHQSSASRIAELLLREVQFLVDPRSFYADLRERATSELDIRIKFDVLNALRVEHKDEPDNPNAFSDSERLRWFGKEKVSVEDINWQNLSNILLPSPIKGAVFRTHEGGLDRSTANHQFGAEVTLKNSLHRTTDTERIYLPQTVTIYPSEEQARVAAKLLRILTAGSGATILHKPQSDGTKDPIWAVCDNMDLGTHNALRYVFAHLARKPEYEPEIEALQKESQDAVNQRLPDGETWEVLSGMNAYLTLHGRPGVKMYKKLANCKDDPADVALLRLIPQQPLPKLLYGVPRDLAFASDGRPFVNADNLLRIIGIKLLGPNGYAICFQGKANAVGEIIQVELIPIHNLRKTQSIFGAGNNVAMAVNDTISWVADKVLGVAGGAVAVAGYSVGLAAGLSSNAVVKTGAAWINSFTEKPLLPQNPLVALIHKGLVAATDKENPNEAVHFKKWIHRDLPDVLLPTPEKIADYRTRPLTEDRQFFTPSGVVQIPEEIMATRGEKAFRNFMQKQKLWPTQQMYGDNGRFKYPETLFESGFYAERDKLAIAFARWCDQAIKEKFLPFTTQVAGEFTAIDNTSKEYADALSDFLKYLNHVDRLPGDTAQHIVEKTSEAMIKGYEKFLSHNTDRTR